jgi:hypothetical protein
VTQLPNTASAVLDIRKLEHYCLDPLHPRGRHKARVFRETLGINQSGARWLRDSLLAGILHAEAVRLGVDRFGERWRVDVRVSRQERAAVIRTLWIVRAGEIEPRFVTCWVL